MAVDDDLETCSNCGNLYHRRKRPSCPQCGAAPGGVFVASNAIASSPSAPPQRDPMERLVNAQLATTVYLRALFLLVIAGVVASATAAGAAFAQQQAFATCVNDGYGCSDGMGGFVLVVGGLLSLALLIVAIVDAAVANGYHRRAGG